MALALQNVALGEQLADQLRSQIICGDITSGTHLVEGTVAEEYGVSRGPVRDALRTLQGEGLLESRKQGYFTRAFSASDIDELYEIRSAAEHLACRLAIQRGGEDTWRTAQLHVDAMRKFAESGDAHGYARADVDFHTEFYVHSGNVRLLNLWQQFQPTFATLMDITNAQDADLHRSFRHHVDLLALAREGKAKEFDLLLSAHLERSRARMSRSQENPDWQSTAN
jgi:GntR family transcriptional regulator of gluconate operon